MKLPLYLKKYFWNIEFSKLSLPRDAVAVSEQILEYGDPRAIAWLFAHMDRRIIREVVVKRRGLSPRSRFFWSNYFKIPISKILWLKKSYLKRRKELWPY